MLSSSGDRYSCRYRTSNLGSEDSATSSPHNLHIQMILSGLPPDTPQNTPYQNFAFLCLAFGLIQTLFMSCPQEQKACASASVSAVTVIIWCVL